MKWGFGKTEPVDFSGSGKIPVDATTFPAQKEIINYYPRFSSSQTNLHIPRAYTAQHSSPLVVADPQNSYNDNYNENHNYDERNITPSTITYEGIPRRTFWIVVGVMAILLAAVGGGVGGIFAHEKNGWTQSKQQYENSLAECSSAANQKPTGEATAVADNVEAAGATKTVTLSQSAASSTSTGGVVRSCPGADGGNYTASNDGEYKISCNQNWAGADIYSSIGMTALKKDMNACMDYCDSWNRIYSDDTDKLCVGVVFQYSCGCSIDQDWDAGNCFLKTEMHGEGTGCGNCDSAKLVGGTYWDQL